MDPDWKRKVARDAADDKVKDAIGFLDQAQMIYENNEFEASAQQATFALETARAILDADD